MIFDSPDASSIFDTVDTSRRIMFSQIYSIIRTK